LAPRAKWRRGLSLWGPPAIYALAIFVSSSLSAPPSPPQQLTDKHAHGLGYAGLALTLVRATAGGTWAGVTARTAGKAAALAVMYGATDEWHQSFVPGRQVEMMDLGADALGAVATAGLVWVAARWARRRAPADSRITPDTGKVSPTP
jgi:VanZ family protein